tara:strand:- start:879 stop:998 length:120 start_codon:yes stop_codon:yes gene_type:complete
MFCQTKGCDNFTLKGFRKCLLCIKGYTPDKRKTMESEEE